MRSIKKNYESSCPIFCSNLRQPKQSRHKKIPLLWFLITSNARKIFDHAGEWPVAYFHKNWSLWCFRHFVFLFHIPTLPPYNWLNLFFNLWIIIELWMELEFLALVSFIYFRISLYTYFVVTQESLWWHIRTHTHKKRRNRKFNSLDQVALNCRHLHLKSSCELLLFTFLPHVQYEDVINVQEMERVMCRKKSNKVDYCIHISIKKVQISP